MSPLLSLQQLRSNNLFRQPVITILLYLDLDLLFKSIQLLKLVATHDQDGVIMWLLLRI